MTRGSKEAALKNFDRAVRHAGLFDKAIEPFIGRSRCQLELGNAEKALEDANTAIKLRREMDKYFGTAGKTKPKTVAERCKLLHLKLEATKCKAEGEIARRCNKLRLSEAYVFLPSSLCTLRL